MLAAVGAGVALLLITVSAVCAIRQGFRSWKALQAARALVDMHTQVLNDTALLASRRLDPLVMHAEELHDAVSDLQASTATLNELVSAVPAQRENLRQKIVELVLVTRRDSTVR